MKAALLRPSWEWHIPTEGDTRGVKVPHVRGAVVEMIADQS